MVACLSVVPLSGTSSAPGLAVTDLLAWDYLACLLVIRNSVYSLQAYRKLSFKIWNPLVLGCIDLVIMSSTSIKTVWIFLELRKITSFPFWINNDTNRKYVSGLAGCGSVQSTCL